MLEGLPRAHNHANFHLRGFKNVASRLPKSPKLAISGINLPLIKIQGSIEKLEYRCTTRNLPLCNGTIIVLKIALLHSVSVITIFVIPKRDKQTDKKITLFRLQPARATQDPHHTWHGDRGRPYHFCTPPNFFDPRNSFATRGY